MPIFQTVIIGAGSTEEAPANLALLAALEKQPGLEQMVASVSGDFDEGGALRVKAPTRPFAAAAGDGVYIRSAWQ